MTEGGATTILPNSEEKRPRLVVTPQMILKVLAVLGVLLLVYFLIYLGTWLAMLN